MSQTDALLQTLKQTLRAERITYADIADELEMSVANVKRLFATRSFNLYRLEKICAMMHMDLVDLLRLHESKLERIRHLSEEQEQELVGDMKLLLVAVSVRNGLEFDAIIDRYQLSDHETLRCLARLDRLGIIELQPGNRFKLLIDDNFTWLPDGPIDRFYQQKIQQEFLDAGFNAEVELRQFQFGLLGENACAKMKQKLRETMREFTELHHADLALPIERRYSMGLLVAMRPWEMSAFKPLIEKSNERIDPPD
jgi:DNA-binding Xre family transcriptional regulator